MITAVLILAAVAVVLWPKAPPAPQPFEPVDPSPLQPPRPPHPSYHTAIAALAQVRQRVAVTDTLGEAETKAIETITLALVAGSGKE
jgi:hypothetical protein